MIITGHTPSRKVPLVVHILHRFECGGMQTLLAECLNRMPTELYRHAVVCLSGFTDYAALVTKPGVEFYTLDKPPGTSLKTHLRLWKLLRHLRPCFVHTYNVGAVEYALTAYLAGVGRRIHAEHGRDSVELAGTHARYNLLRRLLIPFIDDWVVVSADLASWLVKIVRVPADRITCIPGGVDTDRYAPCHIEPSGQGARVLIGTVGRIDKIKNHALLLDAFSALLRHFGTTHIDLRLIVIGDGPLFASLRERVHSEPWGGRVSLPGAVGNVAELLRTFDVFVLPSLSEATPVTVLEAMASALPVVASRVGGVPQLVIEHQNGLLVEPSDLKGLVDAIAAYVGDESLRRQHGSAGREHVIARCSIEVMVASYVALYGNGLPHSARR